MIEGALPLELAVFGSKIHPLRDMVAWIREEYEHPLLDIPAIKTNRGTVVAVGPGRRIRRKVKCETGPNQYEYYEVGMETGGIRPITVKPGDFLEFSPYGQYEHTIEGRTVVFSGEKSVLGYADRSDTQGVMFPTPAGFDDSNREVVAKVSM